MRPGPPRHGEPVVRHVPGPRGRPRGKRWLSVLLGVFAQPPPCTDVPFPRTRCSVKPASCSHSPCPYSPGPWTRARSGRRWPPLRREAGGLRATGQVPAVTSGRLGRPAKLRGRRGPAAMPFLVHRRGLLAGTTACLEPSATGPGTVRTSSGPFCDRPVCHPADHTRAPGSPVPSPPQQPSATLSPSSWCPQCLPPPDGEPLGGGVLLALCFTLSPVTTPCPARSRSCKLLSESALKTPSVTPWRVLHHSWGVCHHCHSTETV